MKNYIILTLVVLVLCVLGFYECVSNENKAPTRIFYKSIQSVVEVKAVTKKQESFGTAVFMDSKGSLITNAHVVTLIQRGERIGYDEIYIRFAQEEEYLPVKLIAFDEENDIALLNYDLS